MRLHQFGLASLMAVSASLSASVVDGTFDNDLTDSGWDIQSDELNAWIADGKTWKRDASAGHAYCEADDTRDILAQLLDGSSLSGAYRITFTCMVPVGRDLVFELHSTDTTTWTSPINNFMLANSDDFGMGYAARKGGWSYTEHVRWQASVDGANLDLTVPQEIVIEDIALSNPALIGLFFGEVDSRTAGTNQYVDDVVLEPMTSGPADIENLVATAVSHESVQLSWDAVTDPDLVSYQVIRSEDESFDPTGADGDQMFSVTPPTTTFTDTGLTENTTYYYQVNALDQ